MKAIRRTSSRLFPVAVMAVGMLGVTVARGDSRLDYLEGDGEAYIQTDYILTSADVVEVEFMPLESKLTHIFGSRYSANSSNFSLSIGESGGVYSLIADYAFNGWPSTRLSVGMASLLNNRVRATVCSAFRSVSLRNGQGTWSNTLDVSRSGTLTTPGPICLFYLNGAAFANAKKFTGRIYSFVIRRDGDVALSLVPYEKNGVCGMVDEATGEFYGNAAATGAFGGVGPQYKPVEYIKGDGVAYIDTGTPLTGDDQVEMEFQLDDMNPAHVFGSRKSATEANFSLSINLNGSRVSLMCDFNSYVDSRLWVYSESLTGRVAKVACRSDLRTVKRYADGYVWNQMTPMPTDFVTPGNCYLYYMSGATFTDNKFASKVYFFKILRNGKSRLDLVPWRYGREYGFRDRVSGRFFGNVNPEGGKFCEKPPRGLIMYVK